MNIYKKWIYLVIFFIFFWYTLIGILNYIIDPFQLYSQATFFTPSCEKKQRYYNPGFAKHYDYDSILIGSSMVDNFLPSEIKHKLSFNIIKLPIDGASAYENNIMLKCAIETGKVKNVFLGLDIFTFNGKTTRLQYGEGSFPEHLYDNNILNDYKYLLNYNIFIKSYKIIKSYLKGKRNNHYNRDNVYYWGKSGNYGKDILIKEWELKKFNKNYKPINYTYEKFRKSFESNLLYLIKNNPNINFYIFYPPYSILTWIDVFNKNFLEDSLKFKKYIFESTKDYKNVKIFDFQDIKDITFNLDNYKDISHYSPKINSFIIDSVENNVFLITDDNIDYHLKNLRKQVEGLDVSELLN